MLGLAILTLSVMPHTAFAPATIQIQVHLTAGNNQYLAVVWSDQNGEVGRHEQSLEKDYGNFNLTVQDLQTGDYVVEAVLIRDGKTYRQKTTFHIRGDG